MRILALALMCLILEATLMSVSADELCTYGTANALTDEQIANRGLTEKVNILQAALAKIQADDTAKRNIIPLIIDCHKYNYRPYSIILPGVIAFRDEQGTAGLAQDYGLYVSTGYLRFSEAADIERLAREQVCRIYAGLLNRGFLIPKSAKESVYQCRSRIASYAGDYEEARWFERLLSTHREDPFEWAKPEPHLELPAVPKDAPKGRLKGDEFR